MITRQQIKLLAESTDVPCISILMPVYQGAEGRQNAVRLRNALRDAAEQLEKLGPDLTTVIDPLKAKLDDPDFWAGSQRGLAVYVSPSGIERFHLQFDVEELVLVANHFHITPLLQALASEARFYLLALSQNQARLFHMSEHRATELFLPETMPRSLSDYLKYEEPDRQVALNQTERGSNTSHHAHGQPDEKGKLKIRDFCKQLDRGLHTVIKDEKAALMLAAVEYMVPLYNDANTYTTLLDVFVPGNPEGLTGEELREKAWPLAQPYLMQAQTKTLARFGDLSSNGLTSQRLNEIVAAAATGRVDALFVASGLHQWGLADLDTGKVIAHQEPGPGDEDLLGLAALQTFLHGGDVYTVSQDEIPDKAPVAALFRY